MRHIAIALVLVMSTFLPLVAYANGPMTTFVGCPVGQAIQGINFVTRTLVCVPVGGNTAALQAQITALQNALAAVQATIGCMSKVGDDVFFEACNVHIRSGGGATDAAINGLGNLIIGYDEINPLGPAKTGSHNVVIGPRHTYSSYGGLVAGHSSSVTAPNATVTGGSGNIASGRESSISGGLNNRAGGRLSSISGGESNRAFGDQSSISGGAANLASGEGSSVSGGQANTASGVFSSVSGGDHRTVIGEHDWRAGNQFEEF